MPDICDHGFSFRLFTTVGSGDPKPVFGEWSLSGLHKKLAAILSSVGSFELLHVYPNTIALNPKPYVVRAKTAAQRVQVRK